MLEFMMKAHRQHTDPLHSEFGSTDVWDKNGTQPGDRAHLQEDTQTGLTIQTCQERVAPYSCMKSPVLALLGS